MDYWQAVLQEVLNKDDPNYPNYFTSIHKPLQEYPGRKKSVKPSTVFTYEYKAQSVNFTQREVQTLYHLLQGYNIREIGEAMGLSSRTIEFYLKGVRSKFDCPSKKILLKIMRQIGLDQYILRCREYFFC